MLTELRKLPLFPGAEGVDPTITEVTFGDFEGRLRRQFEHEYKQDQDGLAGLLRDLIGAATVMSEALSFLSWWLLVKFEPEMNCNVRPFYLPGFSGMTKDLPKYRTALGRIRKTVKVITNEKGLEGVDDTKLRRYQALATRKAPLMMGPIFDIDAHVLFLLHDAMSGSPKERLSDLSTAFDEGTEESRDRIRKKISSVRRIVRSFLRKSKQETAALSSNG